jgi:NADPH:quinone reductase-like Zn-dependent oxidoreductase
VRAAVRSRYGPPDVVRVTDVPRPTVGDGDLLVRVHRTTVNRTDCAVRAGTPFFLRLVTGLPRPKAHILGTEFAGVVAETGPAVREFAVGDRVFGYVEGRYGAHAEYLAVPERASIAAIPDGVSFDAAAAATEGAHYALAFLRVAKVRPGQHVLVHGATGGIGAAAVQLLKVAGARVTAVALGRADVVAGLGADRVVDLTVHGPSTLQDRFDAVFDAVGKSTFGFYRPLLAPRGIYLSSELGPKAQNPFLALVGPLSPGRRVGFPFPRHDAAMIRELAGLLADGRFRPLVDRCYPLGEIAAAYEYVESGRKLGNVVVQVTSDDG